MRGRVWRLVVFVFIVGFTLNLVGIVSHVAVSSLARRWFATPLPGAFTTEWYAYSWREFQLADVLTVTATVAVTVTALARHPRPRRDAVTLCGLEAHQRLPAPTVATPVAARRPRSPTTMASPSSWQRPMTTAMAEAIDMS